MTDERARLATHLPALAAAKVLVLGDLMLDRYRYGSVERISPEAPIPVIRLERETRMLGGAGNVLRNLAALSVEASLVALIGDDPAGAEVAALVEAEGPGRARLVAEAGRPTSIKERTIAGTQQLLRADREAVARPSAATAEALQAAAEAVLPSVGALILSDYGKGVLTPGLLACILAAARKRGCPVVVDPKGRDYGVYRGASVVTPNRRELAEASGRATGSQDEIVAACRKVIEEAGIEAILATRSEQGMTLVTAAGTVQHLAAEAREVYDVSGAGDTVVALLAAGLAGGLAIGEAMALANVAAGIVVGKAGTAVVQPDELLRRLHTEDLLAAEAKVVERAGMIARAQAWRRAGLKIGFTNGCFDLLHPGHVHLLRQARAACDRLVVGLNSDASVARLKGPGRPVQSEAARAAVLASLASVDQVVIFGEETPLALIEALRPELLVKGADYAKSEVVGADLVESYGGRVLLVGLAEGHSTSATIERLRG
ncbi:MAG: D-glycero-beta-D-manno-heptose-7-phosphate kinase [Kiloniellales bacterium]